MCGFNFRRRVLGLQFSLNTIAAVHAANAALQNLTAGGVAPCKMANAESCMTKKVLERFCICRLLADEEQQNITRCM